MKGQEAEALESVLKVQEVQILRQPFFFLPALFKTLLL